MVWRVNHVMTTNRGSKPGNFVGVPQGAVCGHANTIQCPLHIYYLLLLGSVLQNSRNEYDSREKWIRMSRCRINGTDLVFVLQLRTELFKKKNPVKLCRQFLS